MARIIQRPNKNFDTGRLQHLHIMGISFGVREGDGGIRRDALRLRRAGIVANRPRPRTTRILPEIAKISFTAGRDHFGLHTLCSHDVRVPLDQ